MALNLLKAKQGSAPRQGAATRPAGAASRAAGAAARACALRMFDEAIGTCAADGGGSGQADNASAGKPGFGVGAGRNMQGSTAELTVISVSQKRQAGRYCDSLKAPVLSSTLLHSFIMQGN